MSKIIISLGQDALNRARQAGITAASAAVRTGLYRGSLRTPITIFENDDERLRGSDLKTDNGVILETDAKNKIEFIDAIIDVTQANDIKSTTLVNRRGTVKELIQQKDYTVIIKGNLFAEKNKFPHTELQVLQQILSEAESIKIASAYCSIFGIDQIVLKSADFNQSSLKHFNVMPFTLTLESDMDYDFLVSE